MCFIDHLHSELNAWFTLVFLIFNRVIYISRGHSTYVAASPVRPLPYCWHGISSSNPKKCHVRPSWITRPSAQTAGSIFSPGRFLSCVAPSDRPSASAAPSLGAKRLQSAFPLPLSLGHFRLGRARLARLFKWSDYINIQRLYFPAQQRLILPSSIACRGCGSIHHPSH